MKRTLLFVCISVIVCTPSAALALQSSGRTMGDGSAFSYDNNGDGMLSMSEFQAWGTLEAGMNEAQAQNQFIAMDVDSNGFLTPAEFNAGICCV